MQTSFTQKTPHAANDTAARTPETPNFLTLLLAQLKIHTGNENVRNKALTHVTMVVVALLVIGLSQMDLAWGTINAIHPLKYDTNAVADTATNTQPLSLPLELRNIEDDVLVRGAVPRTIIPDRSPQNTGQAGAVTTISGQLQTYAVQSGDNISIIAARFGLRPETIVWANPDLENNPDVLSIGQELTILPVDGVYHQIGGGDTIDGIAATFQTDPSLIINHPLNNIDADNPVIQAGAWLVVPGGNKPFKPRAVTAYSGPVPDNAALGSGIFGWPATGSISQGYFGYHPGLDIAGWVGAPVLAADSGYVVAAGWDSTGYGLNLVIDHGNGFQTLYAHLDSYYIEPGTNVSKGQQVGEMGNTGNSTGPHLHFEIRHGTVQRNPYGFLP
jgi:murein DD-endopeptidase MepM/ murein hydrolase activator NlpD